MIYDLRIGQEKESGFTFIELLISISIIMLLVGGVMASFNSFAVKNKLDNAKEEVMSNLRLARSYAVSMQGAQGTTGSNLKYVKVISVGGSMTATMDVGKTYFSTNVAPAEMTVAMTPNPLLFGAYEGKAGSLSGSDIEFFGISGAGETAAIKLTLDAAFGTDSRTIIVNAAGVINEQK